MEQNNGKLDIGPAVMMFLQLVYITTFNRQLVSLSQRRSINFIIMQLSILLAFVCVYVTTVQEYTLAFKLKERVLFGIL